jgi:hypothetical protein
VGMGWTVGMSTWIQPGHCLASQPCSIREECRLRRSKAISSAGSGPLSTSRSRILRLHSTEAVPDRNRAVRIRKDLLTTALAHRASLYGYAAPCYREPAPSQRSRLFRAPAQ